MLTQQLTNSIVRFLIVIVLLMSIIGVVRAQEIPPSQPPLTPQAKIQKEYDQLLESFPKSLDGLSDEQLTMLFKSVNEHPVASLDKLSKYDFQATGIGDGEVGFCYGRAMTVHLMARKMGLKPEKIAKIFVAGDLKNAQVRWRFHMATIVKAQDQSWRVIDPILPALGKPGIVDPNTWIKEIKEEFDLRDGSDDSHVFVTDTNSIMVDMRVIPALRELEIQDRLIEPTFNPEGKEGFEKIELIPGKPAISPVYFVKGHAQQKYFIMRDEPAVSGKKINDFDFFNFATVILYKVAGDINVQYLPRHYAYNNYFVDLLKSFQASPATNSGRADFPRSLVTPVNFVPSLASEFTKVPDRDRQLNPKIEQPPKGKLPPKLKGFFSQPTF